MMFIICDAKYYNIVLCANELLEGNPGVEDVTKQYLYQLAYKDFFEKEEITRVFNCFIMPSDEEYVKNVGYVSLSFLKNLGLSDIQIIKYPANLLLNNFIQNKKDSILLYLKWLSTIVHTIHFLLQIWSIIHYNISYVSLYLLKTNTTWKYDDIHNRHLPFSLFCSIMIENGII